MFKQKRFFIFLLTIILLVTSYSPLFSWGFFGHKRINKMSIFGLPPEMIGFYKKHIVYITEHAVDPDKRRYTSATEAPCHYIDLDHYGINPFDSIPKYWKKAVAKFSEDTLRAYGIVPWHIEKVLYKLTNAFKEENLNQILHLSADLGHYVADAHVPLHTTENYNGQMTNQKGIHAFWESRIPELNADNYNYFVGKVHYIDKPIDKIWEAVRDSHLAKDSVLLFEEKLNSKFPVDKKYSYEHKGKVLTKVYSREYTQEYDKMLHGMVERRMRAAISMVGSLWYTAWVNAGQPDLNKIVGVADTLKVQTEEDMLKNVKAKSVKGHEN